jgi:predicted ATP-grasp superfamily ATP-dependent carboligase
MTTAPGELPRLAVVFDPRATFSYRIAAASAGLWETLWLVDTLRYDIGPVPRLLARLGTVIDIAGLEPGEVADRLAPFRPAGIIAFVDSELVHTALIARAAGLQFHSPEVALRLTSKVEQRAALARSGLAVPKFWPLTASADDATKRQVAEAARYPVIVKPQAGAGSRRTYRAVDATELLRGLAEPADVDDELADVVVEELLVDGWPRDSREYADMVSVESVAQDGRVTHLTVTGRLTFAEPFRESGSFIPSNLPDDMLAAVRVLASQAIHALGAATNGVFHTEIKITPDGPRIVEVNGRIGGRTPEMLETCSELRLFELAARVALGLPLNIDEMPSSNDAVPSSNDAMPSSNDSAPTINGVAYLAWVQPPMSATSLVKLDGVDEVAASEGVVDLVVNKRPGDELDWRDGNAGFLIAVLGWAPDHEAMFAARRRISDTIDVEYGYLGTEAAVRFAQGDTDGRPQ